MAVKSKRDRSVSGQMTVEMVVALPVMIAVAVIAVNAVLFLSDCAVFDRQLKLAVCTYAGAPAYGEGSAAVCGHVQDALMRAFPGRSNVAVSVSSSGHSPGYVRYTAQLRYTPTLFSRPFAGSVFGVAVPPVVHEASLTVDPYKPGAVL